MFVRNEYSTCLILVCNMWMHSFYCTWVIQKDICEMSHEDYGSCRPFGIVVKCSEWSLKTSVWVVQCVLKAPTHILKATPPGELNRFTSTVCVASLVSAVASTFIVHSFMEILNFEHCQTPGLRQRIIWVNSEHLGPNVEKKNLQS